MIILNLVFICLLGFIVGSFFNVVGLRIPNNESIVYPGSHCTTCDRNLNWYELIPVFSWIFQKGKCRGCQTKISALYPVTELSTAILFTISPLVVGWSKELLVSWSLISLLIIVTVSDIKYMIIPDKVLLFFAPIFIILRIFIPLDPWWDPVAGFALGFGLLFLIAVVSKGGMGGGDIKLMGVLGIVLGWKASLLAFMLATLFGAVLGVTGLALKLVKRGQPIPFGPYIVLGTLVSYFFYHEIINWYFQLMN
ncbi:leader peptidase (prepilin peptidase) / N-methyltransferase [Bacillus sp. OV194]|nr:leader peptidase (prepilin peptidase) / N-methyltransferase [Bacillus sp. OV194]